MYLEIIITVPIINYCNLISGHHGNIQWIDARIPYAFPARVLTQFLQESNTNLAWVLQVRLCS